MSGHTLTHQPGSDNSYKCDFFSGLLSENFHKLQFIALVCGIGATSFSNANFGHGSGPILLDNVQCTGRETRLFDCSNVGVGRYSSNCGHDDDAGVRCNGEFCRPH